jgi:hypothetical protein
MFTQTTLPLMAGLLFIPITSFADDTAADLNTFSMGIAGQYAPLQRVKSAIFPGLPRYPGA